MTGAIPAIPIESFPPKDFNSGFEERNQMAEAMPPRSDDGSRAQVPMGIIRNSILSVSQNQKLRY